MRIWAKGKSFIRIYFIILILGRFLNLFIALLGVIFKFGTITLHNINRDTVILKSNFALSLTGLFIIA